MTKDAPRTTKDEALRQSANQPLQQPGNERSATKRDLLARHPKLVQRLESRLIDAWELSRTQGLERSLKSLSDVGTQTQGSNVVVIVQCQPETNPQAVATPLVSLGAQVVRTGETHVKAVVPIQVLDQVANLPGVSYVRSPILPRGKNSVITQGRAATAANGWHVAGFTGQGVKIAIMDTDFANLPTRKANDEIPASAVEVDFTGTGMNSGSDGHGCACAEIVYDMAPAAQLYLLKTQDPSDDEAAKNYCKAQGIHIVSQSAGYDGLNFHNGVPYSSIAPHPVAIANDANNNGILWINAAGNEAYQHAITQWRDANANSYLDWDNTAFRSVNEIWNGGNSIPAGTVLDIYLTWNSWPVTAEDFDLDLYRWNGSAWAPVTSAEDLQNGTQPPRERLLYVVPTAGRYAVGIYRYNASTSPWFILRCYPYDLFYFGYNNFNTPVPGSVAIPADAASVFSVGAIDYANYAAGPIEPFSSLGPNNGTYTGDPTVMKPDICGPDMVNTATYGNNGFPGTSASTPHMAGLAALVKGRFPAYSNNQIRAYLESFGVDLGTAGKDTVFGSGPCVLPLLDTTRPNVTITNPPGNRTYTNAQTVLISANASDNVGVTMVEFYDGANKMATDLAAPYSFDWAITASNNGAHIWTARAYDAMGNSRTSAAVTLTVSIDITPPTITISSPANGQTVTTASITISGTAADPGSPASGVGLVEVRLNGGSWTNATGTASWTRALALAPCTNTVEARSRDRAGNYSSNRLVTVTYLPPNTVPTRPLNLSPSNNAINVSITPTLQAGAFTDADCVGDTHAASQWQVLNSAGTIVVADSGTSAVNLISWTVPTNRLYYGSNYQWRVRYRDSRNGWSSNSIATTFRTAGPLLTGTRSGTNLVFKWPTNAPGFTLQWTTNVTGTTWSNATPLPVIVSGYYTVTNGMTNKVRFYRLRK